VFVQEQGLDARPMRPSTQLVGRCVVASGVAAAATAAVAWWSSGTGSARWWLAPAIAIPAALAAGWAALGRGTAYRWTVALVAVVSCALVAWFVWVPEPHLYSVVRDHQASATETAERVIAGWPAGTCRVPTAADLGVLTAAGPWAKVCVAGVIDGSFQVYVLRRPAGSGGLDLTYTTTRKGSTQAGPDSCYQRIVGNWVAHAEANLSDPGDPCPYRFHFEGGP
jgi:hypothetical protein